MANEVALEEIASITLRRLLAYDKSFNRADVKVGNSSLVHKASICKCALRRRGPAVIPGIDGTGATVNFQSQTFSMARY